ncbi:MAG: hypothetical protein RIQ52_909 [Pseudomonadota bacterium]|jgi:chromosome partitioning protein
MSKIIAVTNQKGGVGKTTTSVNLAASLAAMRYSVLLVDLDPQGNSTMGCGIGKKHVSCSSYEVLVRQASIQQAKVRPDGLAFDVLPANTELAAAQVDMLGLERKERVLAEALVGISDLYDYVLIDCPPSLNLLTINAMVAAQSVLIPMQCEYYALEGLSDLMDTLKNIRDSVNPGLAVEGLLRTMFDTRSRLANEVSEQLLAHFGDKVFRTIVPRNIRLAEAPSHGVPAIIYDKASKGALAYLALAGEILRRNEKQA